MVVIWLKNSTEHCGVNSLDNHNPHSHGAWHISSGEKILSDPQRFLSCKYLWCQKIRGLLHSMSVKQDSKNVCRWYCTKGWNSAFVQHSVWTSAVALRCLLLLSIATVIFKTTLALTRTSKGRSGQFKLFLNLPWQTVSTIKPLPPSTSLKYLHGTPVSSAWNCFLHHA